MAVRRKEHRRLASYSKSEEHWEEERKQFIYRVDKPLHQTTDSLFSTSSGFTDYRGLLNLAIVLIVMGCTRLSLENIMKYGILIDPFETIAYFLKDPYSWPSFSLVVLSNFYILFGYFVEKCFAVGFLSEKTGKYLHITNIVACVTFVAMAVLYIHPSPFFSSICMAIHVCIVLKLYSYADVNRWCREQNVKNCRKRPRCNTDLLSRSVSDDDSLSSKHCNGDSAPIHWVIYPDNLSLRDIYYFMFAPTLCYELNFPRSGRIRKRFLMKRIVEMIFLCGLLFALIQQWIIPSVESTLIPFKEMHLPKVLQRLLKLAVPNLCIWLIFFYTFFHSTLNVLAEVLQFGDRTFYRDWWNAETVAYFWANWNMPVHRWAVRHMYKPLVRKGYSKFQASVVIFMLSAFVHEYLVSVPLNMFRLWSFTAMLGQIPFAYFVSHFLNGKYGNMAVWLSIVIGQPFAILMYYHDYYILNY